MQSISLGKTLAYGTKAWRLYVIHNSVVDRWYVGQTAYGKSRIKNHFRNSTQNALMMHDVKLHGIDSFLWRFLDPVYHTEEAAKLAEAVMIVQGDTIFPRGYNAMIEIREGYKLDRLRQELGKTPKFKDLKGLLPLDL